MVKNEKGITLLETLVAMVIFSSVALSANSFLIGFVGANKSIENLSKATEIGNKVLENLRTKSYDSIKDDGNVINKKYKCTWKVEDNTSMKQITLTIAWPINKLDHSIKLSTIIAK